MRLHRRSPPELRAGVLLRARLLATLLQRYERRVVVITAPAGFGKTTLLAQALHENAIAPRGVDLWLSCEAGDASRASMLAGLSDAVGSDPDTTSVVPVAEAVLRLAPTAAAVIVDDAHEVPPDSGGAEVLDELLASLPANAHLVLAGRTDPTLHLARLDAAGEVVRIGEDDLRLTDTELGSLAALNGVPGDHLDGSGGWPALASLCLTSPAGTSSYVWEEVLEQLSPAERRTLAALVAVDGADADLLRAMTDDAVDLDRLCAVTPLLERRGSTVRPHALWHSSVDGVLGDDELSLIRRRAADALRARGELARAAALVLPTAACDDDWAVLREIVADCCTVARWVAHADLLTAWWASFPVERKDEPAALLLQASVSRLHQLIGEDTRPLLEEALAAAHDAGEHRVELAVLSQLGHVAWWHDDLATLARLYQRAMALEAEGWEEARGPVAIGGAMVAQLAHDHDTMLATIERVDRARLDPGMAAAADWLHVRALVALGRGAEGIDIADRAASHPGFAFQAARAERVFTRWFSGRTFEAIDLLDELDAGGERLPRDRFLLGVITAGGHALLGQVEAARQGLDIASAAAGTVEGLRPRLFLGYTRALVALAEDDEEAAAGELRATLGSDPIDVALVDTLRVLLAVVHVLLPERRAELAALPHGPDQRAALAVAEAFVAVRERRATTPVDAERALGALGLRWALELCARAGDVAAARILVDRFAVARELLRATPAGADLLRSLPVPPASPLHLRVLGPAQLSRGGEPVTHADWRRERVRSLLLLLVARRRLSRETLVDALWPDLDGDAGAGNLRATLRYLNKVLEPERAAGDATWFVRVEGDVLHLVGDGLTVDAWEFETLLDEADALDAGGAPSAALGPLESALDLWRGDYLADVYDDWAGPGRERLRARFLAASVRAGELALGQGDVDRALKIATRAVESDPWSEAAHRLVMAAHLARRDRASARRALDRCLAALDELGVEAEEATVMLERSILLPPG